MTSRALLLLAATTWVAQACAGAPNDLDAGNLDVEAAMPTLTPEQYCARATQILIDGECSYRGRCCTTFDRQLLGVDVQSRPFAWSCESGTVDSWTAACIASFRGTPFSPMWASRCIDELAAVMPNALCDGPEAFFGQPAFESALRRCDLVHGAIDPGALGAVGDPCAPDVPCELDLYCAPATTADGGASVCRYRAENGTACGMDGVGFTAAPECRSRSCSGGVCTPRCRYHTR